MDEVTLFDYLQLQPWLVYFMAVAKDLFYIKTHDSES